MLSSGLHLGFHMVVFRYIWKKFSPETFMFFQAVPKDYFLLRNLLGRVMPTLKYVILLQYEVVNNCGKYHAGNIP